MNEQTEIERLQTLVAEQSEAIKWAKEELAKAQACCAEMREAATGLIGGDQIDMYLNRQFPATIGHIPLREYFNLLWSATDNNCGTGWLAPEKRKRVAMKRQQALEASK